MSTYLFQGLILGVTAAFQPGPLQAYLLSLTANYGWRRAVPAAFGPIISDGPILILVLLVLTTFPPSLLYGMQIAGGVFLIYLAYGAFRGFQKATTTEAPSESPAQQSLLKGALVNLLSPNPYIFWATIAGPIFISAFREAPRYGVGFLVGFYVAIVGGFLSIVALFALTGKIDVRLNRVFSGLAAAALFLFGLYQLGTGITKFVSL